MLREPLSLARSQIDFVKARDWYKSHLACIPQGQAACDEASQNTPLPPSKKHGKQLWKFFDNFMLRTLGGPTFFSMRRMVPSVPEGSMRPRPRI